MPPGRLQESRPAGKHSGRTCKLINPPTIAVNRNPEGNRRPSVSRARRYPKSAAVACQSGVRRQLSSGPMCWSTGGPAGSTCLDHKLGDCACWALCPGPTGDDSTRRETSRRGMTVETGIRGKGSANRSARYDRGVGEASHGVGPREASGNVVVMASSSATQRPWTAKMPALLVQWKPRAL
jgi:hypothetical protein